VGGHRAAILAQRNPAFPGGNSKHFGIRQSFQARFRSSLNIDFRRRALQGTKHSRIEVGISLEFQNS
jgi:hypothetical protein